MKNLYHVTTVYHFICAVSDIAKKNMVGKCDIILAPWLEAKLSICDEFNVFFNNKYFYEAVISLKENYEEELIKSNIDKFLENNSIDLDEYDEIIVGGTQYNFGLYLHIINKKFIMFEESCGTISRPNLIYDIDKNIDKARSNLALQYGMYDGSSPYITKIYCDIDNQPEQLENEKFEDFKVIKNLELLSKEEMESLLLIFGLNNKINNEKDTVLVLTQQFTNLLLLDFKSQILIYQLFADLFIKNKNILIKTHPDDMCYYSQIIDNAKIIKEKFPCELIPFVFSNRPDIIATISSTGILPLKSLFNNVIELDYDFLKDYKNSLKYLSLAKLLGILKCSKIKCVGINRKMFNLICQFNTNMISNNEFYENVEVLDNVSSQDILIIDKSLNISKDIKFLSKAKCIFFINEEDELFYKLSTENLANIYVLKISKNQEKEEDCYVDLDDEFYYCYTNNKEISNFMKNAKQKEKLKNTGISFTLEGLDEKDLEIARLKGVLEATQKRLLYYIAKEKEQEKTKGEK